MKKFLFSIFFLSLFIPLFAFGPPSPPNPPPPNSVNIFAINQPIDYSRSVFYIPTTQATLMPQSVGGYPATIASGNLKCWWPTQTPVGSWTALPTSTLTSTRTATPTPTGSWIATATAANATASWTPTPTNRPTLSPWSDDTSFEAVTIVNRSSTSVTILRAKGKYARVHPGRTNPILLFPSSVSTYYPTPTAVISNTPNPIWTQSYLTPTPTRTNTPTNTWTNTATNTPTNTWTNTAINTATNTPTNTAINTATNTPTNTTTATPTQTCNPAITPKCYNQIMG